MTSSISRDTSRRAGVRESGLTLVELLITGLILAALLAGLSQLVVTNSQNANATGALARIADTGRTAIQLLTTDIRRAGYFGGNIALLNSASMIGGTPGVAAPTADCVANNTDWARMVGQPLLGIDAPDDASPFPYACIADHWLRGDVLTLRYAPAQPVAVADMVDGKPYLRTTMTEGRLFFGSGKNNASNALDDLSARDYNLAAHTYFVGPTGRTCQDREIPALFRTTIGDDGTPLSQELLAGVENLQFRYLVGSRYYDADDVPLAADGNWPLVNAVEVTVLVRAECPEVGFRNNGRTFDLAGVTYVPAAEEQDFRRQLFTTTTQLRN